MRLRETGVPEGTIADILWHSTKTMTQHYSVAQIVELHAALEKIKDDSGRWNKSLATLKREQEDLTGNASPPKVPGKEKRPERQGVQAVDLELIIWCGWQDSNPRPLGS